MTRRTAMDGGAPQAGDAVAGFRARRLVYGLLGVALVGGAGAIAPGLTVLVAFGGAGVLILAQGLRQARWPVDTPTARIRSARQGPVELKVRAVREDGAPRRAPLSGEPAAWWTLEARRRETHRGRTLHRRRAWTASATHMLAVEDGTGVCYVALEGARMHPRRTRRVVGDGERAALRPLFPEEQRAALEEPGHWRFIEHRLPDSELFALGVFDSVRSNEPPFQRDWSTEMLRERGVAPDFMVGMAEAAREHRRTHHAGRDRAWEAEMRRLEGIGDDEPLRGTVMVHTLGPLERPREPFRPVILTHWSERAVVAAEYARFLFAGGLCLLLGLGVPLLIEPDRLSPLGRSLRAALGLP